MRLATKAVRENRGQFLALEHPPGLLYLLGQGRQRFVVELVRALRSAFARQQPRQALALEQLLSDIEGRKPRYVLISACISLPNIPEQYATSHRADSVLQSTIAGAKG